MPLQEKQTGIGYPVFLEIVSALSSNCYHVNCCVLDEFPA